MTESSEPRQPTRDWNQRYVDENTPWDSGMPSDHLIRILADYELSPQKVAGGRVLEIGCGTGTNAIYLAEQGFQVKAVDVAPLAIDQANEKAKAAGVDVDFGVVDLLAADAAEKLTGGEPFSFIFDRGVYHCLRRENLDEFLTTMKGLAAPGAIYALLAGNANDPDAKEGGPPQVHAHELALELQPLFELVELRECRFGGVVVEDGPVEPLAWAAVLRRRGS